MARIPRDDRDKQRTRTARSALQDREERAMQRSRNVRPKSPRLLDREIADALAKSRSRVPGYSNYGGSGPFAPLGGNAPPPAKIEGRARQQSGKRPAHATKAKARDKATDKITIDQLAELLGLPSWDDVDEKNQDHYWELSRGAGDEDAQLAAEQEAQAEIYNHWYDAVVSAANKLFDEHGLELDPVGKEGTETRRYNFKVVPFKAWDDAADKIRETVNGVGVFHFKSLRDFLGSGPYTARQAVLAHLGYIKRHPAVYGGPGARQMYEQAWR